MARGRMLNKTISIDPEVATLVNELGGLAGVLYTWMIAHLDRDGRIATAFGLVFGRPVTPAETAAARRFLDPGLRDAGRSRIKIRKVWSTFCQALFASAEFRYVD